uniref:Uncharacterized protein n=1 Tax=Oryza punctata TaxID=4537 RepID=A0A0E0MD99_ORYPU
MALQLARNSTVAVAVAVPVVMFLLVAVAAASSSSPASSEYRPNHDVDCLRDVRQS